MICWFKRKPTAEEMTKAVFALLTEEEWRAMDDIEGITIRDIRELIMTYAPIKKCKHSMEESLKIASKELDQIKNLNWFTARHRVIMMFSYQLFEYD